MKLVYCWMLAVLGPVAVVAGCASKGDSTKADGGVNTGTLTNPNGSASSSGGSGRASSGGSDDSSAGRTTSDESSVTSMTDAGATGASDGAGDDGSTGTDTGVDATSSADGAVADGSTSTGDADANMCATKICIDPVFDCPLQGCFNGCTNFLCN